MRIVAVAEVLTEQEVQQLFAELADEWHEATGGLSVMSRIVSHPAYLAVIGLGPRVLPLIVEELRTRGGWWFAALEALTREVPDGIEPGSYESARNAWLRWAAENGYEATSA
jgi:hypothetical protein